MKAKGFTRGVQQSALKISMRRYVGLPPSHKSHYEKLAEKETRRRLRDLEDERAHYDAALQLHLVRTEALREQEGAKHLLGQNRFSQGEVGRIFADMHSPIFARSVVDQWTSAMMRLPEAPSPGEQSVLDSFVVPQQRAEAKAWVKVAAHNRVWFQDCILRSTKPDHADVAYLVLYATQTPLAASFLRLRRARSTLPLMLANGSFLDMDRFVFQEEYVQDGHGAYVEGADISGFEPDGGDIVIIWNVGAYGTERWVSDAEAVGFPEFVRDFPPPAASREKGQRTKVPKSLAKDHPWLKEILGLETRREFDERTDSGDASELQALWLMMGDDEVEAAWDRLQAKRDELDPAKDGSVDFVIQIRGGRSTYLKKQVAADCVTASARGALAKSFCKD